MASRTDIESYTNTLPNVGGYRDYGPNGLPVEGRADVRSVACGLCARREHDLGLT